MRAIIMTTQLPVFRLLLAIGAALILTGLPSPSRAQNIVVMVNGDPITDFDIEQRSKLDQLTTLKTPARQEVISELIDDRVKMKEGKKYGVDPGVSDINQSYDGMAQRMRSSPDQLTKSLEVKGVRPETLKSRMKAEMVWTCLVRGRFKEKLLVGEKDVAQAVQAQTGDKLQIEGTEYKMQPIVLIVPRGSSAAFMEPRKKEAETYRARVDSRDDRISQPLMANRAAKPLALTLGEPAGIGPDITIAAWLRRRELNLPAFYLLGDEALIAQRAAKL